VKNCKYALKDSFEGIYKLSKNTPNPFPVGYKPELDVTKPLEPELTSYYQSLVGVMRWMVELGRIGIAVEVSLMSSHKSQISTVRLWSTWLVLRGLIY